MNTKMYNEAHEAPSIIENQLKLNDKIILEAAQQLQQFDPYSLVSIARGSSDHAAQFMNYLAMEKLASLDRFGRSRYSCNI